MIVMCFDLSSKQIGVTFAQIQKETLSYVNTIAIIPREPSAKELGYTTQKPKKVFSGGDEIVALLKPGEHTISKKEAKARVSEFKHYKHRELLKDIGKQCGHYLSHVKPHVIAIERNKVFNGVLTTKLLAEIAGGLYFYAGTHHIPIYDYDEATIRAKIRKDIPLVNLTKEGTNKMALDTKWEIHQRLKYYFEQHHPKAMKATNMTMDESDSLAVFYHLYTTHLQ